MATVLNSRVLDRVFWYSCECYSCLGFPQASQLFQCQFSITFAFILKKVHLSFGQCIIWPTGHVVKSSGHSSVLIIFCFALALTQYLPGHSSTISFDDFDDLSSNGGVVQGCGPLWCRLQPTGSVCCGCDEQIHMDCRSPVEKEGLHGHSLRESVPRPLPGQAFIAFQQHYIKEGSHALYLGLLSVIIKKKRL